MLSYRQQFTTTSLILGGTGINEFSKDYRALDIMTEVITKARFVVCFSPTIRDKAVALWPDIPLIKLALIPQAVHTCSSSFNLMTYLSSRPEGSYMNSSYQKPLVFVFVGGIRPVKNPTYLVPLFQEWHAKDRRILLLIVGPKTARDWLYIPGLPVEDTHAINRANHLPSGQFIR
ncbi:Glycosyltransferase 1 domain-containing protein 1 [Bulinus truncatus]|nr:Glycosyltransferase 1 domain-containing protein 1 [Bulinus truncatus]